MTCADGVSEKFLGARRRFLGPMPSTRYSGRRHLLHPTAGTQRAHPQRGGPWDALPVCVSGAQGRKSRDSVRHAICQRGLENVSPCLVAPIISDGGPEFQRDFGEGLELRSIFQPLTDASSPWQNGLAERHGGEVKRRVVRDLTEGGSIIDNLDDLQSILSYMVVCKNQRYSRAGFSPAQLVFGRGLRVPEELLSDRLESTPGRQTTAADPTELDGPAREFEKSCRLPTSTTCARADV